MVLTCKRRSVLLPFKIWGPQGRFIWTSSRWIVQGNIEAKVKNLLLSKKQKQQQKNPTQTNKQKVCIDLNAWYRLWYWKYVGFEFFLWRLSNLWNLKIILVFQGINLFLLSSMPVVAGELQSSLIFSKLLTQKQFFIVAITNIKVLVAHITIGGWSIRMPAKLHVNSCNK